MINEEVTVPDAVTGLIDAGVSGENGCRVQASGSQELQRLMPLLNRCIDGGSGGLNVAVHHIPYHATTAGAPVVLAGDEATPSTGSDILFGATTGVNSEALALEREINFGIQTHGDLDIQLPGFGITVGIGYLGAETKTERISPA